MDVCVGRKGFSVWPFAYRTRVEFLEMCQVKPKHRLMKNLFEDFGLKSMVLFIMRVHPICQTGNTDILKAFKWGCPMAESGGREERKEELWRGMNLAGSHSRRPRKCGCFDPFRLGGCGNEEIQERAA